MIEHKDKNISSLIGLVTIQFSRLEALTIEYLSVLICGHVSVENYIIFQEYTLERKIQSLKNLIKLKYNGHFENIQLDLLNRINALKETRNLFIHGNWIIPENNDLDNLDSLSVRSIKYHLKSPNNGIIDKIWEKGEKRTFTKSAIIDFYETVEKITSELKEIMTENERILGNNQS